VRGTACVCEVWRGAGEGERRERANKTGGGTKFTIKRLSGETLPSFARAGGTDEKNLE